MNLAIIIDARHVDNRKQVIKHNTELSILIKKAKHAIIKFRVVQIVELGIRKCDVNGEVIGNYLPANTGDLENYQTIDIPIKTTFGINELTFIARTNGSDDLINLKSFELSPVSAGYICLDITTRTQTENVQAATSAQTGAALVSIRCSAQQSALSSLTRST